MSDTTDLDRRLSRASLRRADYLAEGDHRSAEIELQVNNSLLDLRTAHTAHTASKEA